MAQKLERFSLIEVFESETRRTILELLFSKKSNGETLRNLVRELGIPLPTLIWHMKKLEEFDLVVKKKINRELVYIITDFSFDFDYELKVLELSFKSPKAKIFYNYLLSLENNEIFTLNSVLSYTSWSSRTVLRYISKLITMGIIERPVKGRGYKVSTKYFFKLRNQNNS